MEHIECETKKVNMSNWQMTKGFIGQWFKKPSPVNKNINLL